MASLWQECTFCLRRGVSETTACTVYANNWSSLHYTHASSDLKKNKIYIHKRLWIAVAAFTMGRVTMSMHVASLDNCNHLNINDAPLSAVEGHARDFACRWHQTENKDQRQEKSHLFHSLCNAKALGESACSISGLRKRSWMWDVAGTVGSTWYQASKIEKTLYDCCCYDGWPGFTVCSLGFSGSVSDASFRWFKCGV